MSKQFFIISMMLVGVNLPMWAGELENTSSAHILSSSNTSMSVVFTLSQSINKLLPWFDEQNISKESVIIHLSYHLNNGKAWVKKYKYQANPGEWVLLHRANDKIDACLENLRSSSLDKCKNILLEVQNTLAVAETLYQRANPTEATP